MSADAASCLLSRKWRRNTLCEVFLVDGKRIVKRYWVRPGVHGYPRPWRREHEAMLRLAGTGFPESEGFTERARKGAREAVLYRRFIPGNPVADLTDGDLREVAGLLAVAHSRGVILGGLQRENFIRDDAGRIRFVGLGRAQVLRRPGGFFGVRVGAELQRLLAETPGADRHYRLRRLLGLYFSARSDSIWRQWVVSLSLRCAAVLQRARLLARPATQRDVPSQDRDSRR